MCPDGRQPRTPFGTRDCELSVIAPAHNEAENLEPFVSELTESLERLPVEYEVIIIDDNSADGSAQILGELAAAHPALRVYHLEPPPGMRCSGQSAAFHAGLRKSRGRFIALIDADLQNSPDDIAPMLEALRAGKADMVQGDRSSDRRDSPLRKYSSLVGRLFRRWLLQDSITDTGCSLRVFKREIGLELPLQYAGMHRFIPVYARMSGYEVIEMAVRHRPRTAGSSKYGIRNRALAGLRDLLAVRWMRSRLRRSRMKALP